MTPARIMHIVWSLEIGGAEKLIPAFVRGADRARHLPGVCVMTKDGPMRKEIEALDAPLYTLERGSILATTKRVTQAVRAFRADL